jgi:predicted DNA-binding transcriptional regulator AlpA
MEAKMMRYLTERDLAERWSVSPRTLQKWRQNRAGPAYVKIGQRIRYRPEDVEEWEQNNHHDGPSEEAEGDNRQDGVSDDEEK